MKKSFIAVLLLLSNYIFAQNNLKATELNIFKNGTYFIVKEGEAKAPNGTWVFNPPASPLLATFWLTTTKDVKVSRIDFKNDSIKVKRIAKNWADIAKANKGKKIRLTYLQSDKAVKEVKGTLLDYFPDTYTTKLKTEDGNTLFITSSSILEFTIEGNVEEYLKTDSIGRVGKVYFNKDIDNTPVKISYMSTGITWTPSYNIKLIDDKNLQLELKALIDNNSENITNADMTITVGNPQFKYGQQIDPFALGYYTGITSAGNNYNAQMYDNSLAYSLAPVQASRAYDQAGYAESSVEYNNYGTYSTTGEKSNDLFKYRLGKVSLEKGTKSLFSVFSSNITYDDIYEVSIYDYVNFASTRYINDESDDDQRFDVFHSLKLKNITSNPFTTAPVFVQDEKLEPLAQDQITYTPVGSTVKVQLSKSPDVLVTNKEQQLKKDDNAKTFKKVVYAKVTIKGSIPIQNLQDKSITLNINKYINGTITEVSDGGEIKVPGKYSGVNPVSTTEWNIKLAPNEKKTVTYTYEVFVYGY